MAVRRWLGVLALCAGLTAGACGCNNARMVQWNGTTGVVAIPRNDNVWPENNREHAEALMREKCPSGYMIVNEEEVVTGQVQHTHVNTSQSGNQTLASLHLDSVNTHTNETTTTEEKKEWRITFQSATAPPVMAPPILRTGAVAPAAVVTPPTPPGLPSQPVPVGQ